MEYVYISVLLDTFSNIFRADYERTSVITNALLGVGDAQQSRNQKVAGFIDVHEV